MLSGPGELAAGNYEKDGAMAADNGSRMERSGKSFARLLEEANGGLGNDLWRCREDWRHSGKESK